MSWVTNIILSYSLGEYTEKRIAEVNQFFGSVPDRHEGGNYEEEPLASVESVWEGKGKALECNVFIGAYNYFPLEDFLVHLRSVTWEEPEAVQLFVKDQEDSKFQAVDVIPNSSGAAT